MKRILIDGKALTTPASLHEALGQNLDFPEYYGKNLDALFDCLSDIHDVTCIVIENSVDAKNALDEYWWRFLEVFSDAQERHGDDRLRLLLM